MSTSVFFQQEDYREEQLLLEDLIIESIQIHGIECFYLPRKKYDVDGVLTEDEQHYFDEALPIEVYLKSADRFGGQRNLLQSWGIEVRDRMTLTVARRRWAQAVGDDRDLVRPGEGDLVYFARDKRLFEVRYVERYAMMYPLGSLPTWDLECELVESMSQRFDTGIAEIDAFEARTSQDLYRFAIKTANNMPLRTAGGDVWVIDSRSDARQDPLDQANTFQQEASAILDFSEHDPFSEGTY